MNNPQNTRQGITQEGRVVKNKVILNLIQDLTTASNKVRSRIQCGMTALLPNGFTAYAVTPQGRYAGYSGHTGFTLIELLVVVLIIGILAAVAVPQYQKAVNKVRIARFLPILVRLQRDLDLYVQTEGVFPLTLDEIMFEPPSHDGRYANYGAGWRTNSYLIRLSVNAAGGERNGFPTFDTHPRGDVFDAQICIILTDIKSKPWLCAPSQSPRNKTGYYQPSKKIHCKYSNSFCRALGPLKSFNGSYTSYSYAERE